MSDTTTPPEASETQRVRVPKLAAEKALPASAIDTLVKIIKGYVVASNGGQNQVNYKDVASVVGLNQNLVSANNSFLSESQIITSPKYGYYLPSESAVRFAREAAWDEPNAKAHLRRVFKGTWFGQVTNQAFAIRSIMTRDELKKSLAIKSGATEGDAAAIARLIDLLVYIGFANESENGGLVRGSFEEDAQGGASANTDVGKIGEKPISVAAEIPNAPVLIPERTNSARLSASPNGISATLTVQITVSQFSDLTEENAERLASWFLDVQRRIKDGQAEGEGLRLP